MAQIEERQQVMAALEEMARSFQAKSDALFHANRRDRDNPWGPWEAAAKDTLRTLRRVSVIGTGAVLQTDRGVDVPSHIFVYYVAKGPNVETPGWEYIVVPEEAGREEYEYAQARASEGMDPRNKLDGWGGYSAYVESFERFNTPQQALDAARAHIYKTPQEAF